MLAMWAILEASLESCALQVVRPVCCVMLADFEPLCITPRVSLVPQQPSPQVRLSDILCFQGLRNPQPGVALAKYEDLQVLYAQGHPRAGLVR